jgi:hypothetical protein
MAEDKLDENHETRQARREEKLKKKRERVAKHGKGLAQMYRNVIMKRIKDK